MKKSSLKTVVIGVGNMGKNHVRIYSQISQLSAVADVSSSLVNQVAAQYGVPAYTDYRQMLDEVKPDAVSVVVPTPFHAAVTLECLKRRLPTLVEKPIALNLADARKMLSAARQYRTFLMVGHVERFNPAVLHLKKLINAGKFGQIISLLSVRVGVSPPKTTGSDVGLDLGIHDIDVFNYLLDSTPKSYQVIKQKIHPQNQADAASMILKYPKTTGLIQTNWVTPIKIRQLYVTGTKRFAELDYINQRITMLELITPKTNLSFFELQDISNIPTKEVYQSQAEPLKEELIYFLDKRNTHNYKLVKSAIAALKVVVNEV